MCQCGCRGWRSLFPVFLFLKWSLAAMKAGVHPHARHDATVFSPEDVVRSLLAVSALGWKAVVVLIKGDWAEFAVRLGLPTWSSKIHPCMLCHASQYNLLSLIGSAGTGKTFLTLLAGMYKVLKQNIYRKMLIARPVVALGSDIGFLPGDVNEKLFHWMQPMHDNLELILMQSKKAFQK